MRKALDPLYSHNKNIQQGYAGTDGKLSPDRIGEFCGSPIVFMDEHGAEIDAIVEADRTIEINSGKPPVVTVEVLPGELICSDGIVRRGTTTEVIGYDKYHAYAQPEGTVKVSISKAKKSLNNLLTWRPDHTVGLEEFALLHTEAA